MNRTNVKDLLPVGVEIIQDEDLSKSGAWIIELSLANGSEFLDDAASVEIIKRDPEVEPRMIAVLKSTAGCDANECRAFELHLRNDRDVVAFVRNHFK